MSQDPYKYFRVEARDLLDQLGKATLDLEKTGNRETAVRYLLRLAHTLKGAARVVKQPEIADHAHALEEALAPHRGGGVPVPREGINALLTIVDAMSSRLATLASEPVTQPSSAVAVATVPAAEEPPRTVSAEVGEVDALLEGLAEAHVQLGALRKAAAQIERARDLSELLGEQLTPRGPRDGRGRTPETAASLAEELRATCGALERLVGGAVDQIDVELRQVRDAAEHLRLVPAGALLTVLERVTRDAAQSLGKRAQFYGRGGDVRIDAHVVSAVQSALVQLVRNAVAHGLETDAERAGTSKPAVGRVEVEIVRRGRRVVFRCEDDGRGVDLDAVRRAAIARGLPVAKAQALGPDELFTLLLRGGISTSTSVTELSGRGVGLDVARAAVEGLGGEIRLVTNRGIGTAFEIVVPLSLAAIEGLTVESAGVVATLPLDAVRRAIRVKPGDLSRDADGEALVFEGKIIPFVRLPRALRQPEKEDKAEPAGVSAARDTSAVVVQAGGRLAALGVDRLLGTSNVVLRPLPASMPLDPIVAGAALDAEGNPQMVLDPEGIVDAATIAKRFLPRSKPAPMPILVVDDSLTTRMLEQSILEAAGYEVALATSGEEGLALARSRRFGLFLVDVEMPGMDGFTFIETTRADPALRDTPAILVTSRATPDDLERGRRAGAQGHIVKSEFDQSDLLARIKRLAG
jgi:two-component system chemotaxis sensor kinase CheA